MSYYTNIARNNASLIENLVLKLKDKPLSLSEQLEVIDSIRSLSQGIQQRLIEHVQHVSEETK